MYRGAYQFLPSTWNNIARAAGRADLVGVDPAAAAPADQDRWRSGLYHHAGAAPWGGRCARTAGRRDATFESSGTPGRQACGPAPLSFREWMRRSRSPDLAIGSFTDDGPWVVDPDAMTWRRDVERLREQARGQVPRWMATGHLPPLGRLVRVVGARRRRARDVGGRVRDGKDRRYSRRDLSRRLRVAFGHLGPTYIKLGQIISGGEGLFPEELVAEFKLLRDRGAARAVRRRAPGRRAGARAFARRRVRVVRPHADRGGVDRAGARGAAAHRRRRRRQGAAPADRRLVREDIEAMAWLAPHLVGRIPVAALANPPALIELFAETIVEELDFRLEAQNMLDIARRARGDRTARDDRATAAPDARHASRARDGTARRHPVGRRRRDARGRRRHRSGAARRARVVHGRRDALRRLPRRPARRQPHGAARRPHGADGLRHHRPARRDEATRVPDAARRRDERRHDGAARARCATSARSRPTPISTRCSAISASTARSTRPTLSADELVHELQDLTKKLLAYGARAPKELMLFVKNMMFLDGAIARLAPDLDILGEIQQVHAEIAHRHGARLARRARHRPRVRERSSTWTRSRPRWVFPTSRS